MLQFIGDNLYADNFEMWAWIEALSYRKSTECCFELGQRVGEMGQARREASCKFKK